MIKSGYESALGYWAARWKPYRDILVRLTLPPRQPTGDPKNHNRTLVICAALHQEKVRRMTKAERAKHPADCFLCLFSLRKYLKRR